MLNQVIIQELQTGPPEQIIFSGLQSCKYLTSCIKVMLRVLSIIPMNERTAVCDTTLPRGVGPNGDKPIFVPKGSQVLLPLYAMQHRH